MSVKSTVASTRPDSERDSLSVEFFWTSGCIPAASDTLTGHGPRACRGPRGQYTAFAPAVRPHGQGGSTKQRGLSDELSPRCLVYWTGTRGCFSARTRGP